MLGPAGLEWLIPGMTAGFVIFSMMKTRHRAALLLTGFFLMGIDLGRQAEIPGLPEVILHARVCGEIKPSRKGWETTVDMIRIRAGPEEEGSMEFQEWKTIRGKASVWFPGNENGQGLVPGSFILARGRPVPPNPPANPFQFDYASYQRGRGILYRLYLDHGSWVSSGEPVRRNLRIRSLLARQHLSGKLRSAMGPGVSDRQLSILNALLLGYRGGLDAGLKADFARSGTMHVLAVSGLHVGIIYLIPYLLLRRLRNYPSAGIPLFLLVFGGLWGYAFLAGLSSSVVRAVSMCCIHAVAMMWRRRVSSLHVVSLTAFLMILARPHSIFEAGFQLSFTAVSGIILLYPRIVSLIRPKHLIGRKAWQMIAVSLAAQLSTMPLTALYFNQLTPFSTLANLVVIPLVTAILYTGCGFLVLTVSGIPGGLLHGLLSILLDHQLAFLERFAGWFSRLPGAYAGGISLLPVQAVLLYAAGLLFIYFLRRRTGRSTVLFLSSLAILLVISGVREFRLHTRDSMHFFHVPGKSAAVLTQGREAYIYGDVQLPCTIDNLPYGMKPYFRRMKLHDPEPFPEAGLIRSPGMEGVLFRFSGKRILILRSCDCRYIPESALPKLDIVLLSNNPRISVASLIRHFRVSQIVTDGSCSYTYSRDVEIACRANGVAFHSTRREGCFSFRAHCRKTGK